jgi:hypothetical protein
MNLDNLRALILAEDLLEALETIALDSEPMAEADEHAERARDLLRAQLALAETDALVKLAIVKLAIAEADALARIKARK